MDELGLSAAGARPHFARRSDDRRFGRRGRGRADHLSEAIGYRTLDRRLWVR